MKADVWSFGVLYFRVMTGGFPFENNVLIKNELFYNIVKKEIIYPEDMECKDRLLLSQILHKEPSSRISFRNILYNLKKMI